MFTGFPISSARLHKNKLIESVSNAALLSRGFSPKLGFLQDFLYIIHLAVGQLYSKDRENVTWDAERSREVAMGGGRAASRFAY
jgi:hypothetical protein